MTSPDLISELLLNEHRNRIITSQQVRLAEQAQGGLTLARRLARPLGRALLDLGARLLIYARPEPTEPQAMVPIRSAHLN